MSRVLTDSGTVSGREAEEPSPSVSLALYCLPSVLTSLIPSMSVSQASPHPRPSILISVLADFQRLYRNNSSQASDDFFKSVEKCDTSL